MDEKVVEGQPPFDPSFLGAGQGENGQAGHQITEDGLPDVIEEVAADLLGLGAGGPDLGDVAVPVLLTSLGTAEGGQSGEELENGQRVWSRRRQTSTGVGHRAEQVERHPVVGLAAPIGGTTGPVQGVDDGGGVGRRPAGAAPGRRGQVLETTVLQPVPMTVQGPGHRGQIGGAEPHRESQDQSPLGLGVLEQGIGEAVPSDVEISGVGGVVEHVESGR